jgi:hypothetical protein
MQPRQPAQQFGPASMPSPRRPRPRPAAGRLADSKWAWRRDRDRQPQLDLNPVGVFQRNEGRVAQFSDRGIAERAGIRRLRAACHPGPQAGSSRRPGPGAAATRPRPRPPPRRHPRRSPQGYGRCRQRLPGRRRQEALARHSRPRRRTPPRHRASLGGGFAPAARRTWAGHWHGLVPLPPRAGCSSGAA